MSKKKFHVCVYPVSRRADVHVEADTAEAAKQLALERCKAGKEPYYGEVKISMIAIASADVIALGDNRPPPLSKGGKDAPLGAKPHKTTVVPPPKPE